MTIWRYLKQLEEEGAVRRIRGGAISNNVRGDMEGLYSQRMYENTEAKRRIASAALPFLDPHGSLFLDAGSTIMSLVKQLPNLRYAIVTSGTNIAIELSQRFDMSVTCVGGQISGGDPVPLRSPGGSLRGFRKHRYRSAVHHRLFGKRRV